MIKVKDLKKMYGENTILNQLCITIKPREVVVVIGPSGAGKSTFLRCINKLEITHCGSICINGADITKKTTDINKVREKVGMVFQDFNLFPHMTVIENIMLAPVKVKKCLLCRPVKKQ